MPSPRILANSPKTFLDRDNWMRAVLAADLPDAAARVGMAIGFHLRVNTGQCNPSFPTLAADSHVSERSTYRLVDLLEHRGWIAVTRTRGFGNQYTLLTPDKAMAGVTADRTPDTAMAGDPCQNDHPTPDTAMAGDPCQYAGSRKAKRAKKEKSGSESESQAPDLASRKKKADAPQEGLFPESESKQQAPPKKKKGDRRSAADDADFERFWLACPKRVAKGAAKKAWDAAIKGGVPAEKMITGMQRYAVERQGQDPKYTKHPATWLNKGCWEDELPGAPVIDQQGNVVAIEQPPPQDKGDSVYERYQEMAAVAYGGKSW